MRPLCWLLGLGVLVAACKPAPACDEPQGPAGVIDEPLMAYLSMARSQHHRADLAEARGDVSAARALLEQLVATAAPAGFAEVAEVRADTLARMAQLDLRSGDLDAASRSAARGLVEVPQEGYYRGHLLEIDGLVEEARSKRLEADGRLAEAEAARQRAIVQLEAAVRIQQAVIERAIQGTTP